MLNFGKIYFKDIFLSFSRNILFSIIGLVSLGLIKQVNLIVSSNVRSGNLHMKIFTICSYITPYLISIFLPFATLISLILLFGKYRRENKIIALQNLSLGPRELKRVIYLAGFLVVIINYWLYFVISPPLYSKFRDIQLSLKQQSISDLIEPKVLKKYGKGITIYVEDKDRKNNLRGIFISDTRDNNSTKSFIAELGTISLEGIELKNGLYYEVSSKGSGFLEFQNYLLKLQNTEKTPRKIDPYGASLDQMIDLSRSDSKVKVALNQKIVWPLYSLLFICICFNLEWHFTYKYYSRINTRRFIPIVICLVLPIIHFLIQNLGSIGTAMTYILPLTTVFFISILTRN